MTKDKPEAVDYGEDAVGPQETGGDVLTRLRKLADEQIEVEALVAQLEAQLAAAKDRLNLISGAGKGEGQLPTMMVEAGLTLFGTTSGLTVKLEEQVYAGIPKAREEEAVQWFDKNGFSKLPRRTYTIEFTKDDEAWARQFEGQMKRRKKQLHCVRRQQVHPSTLRTWVKARLEEGVDIPLDLFGVHTRKVSKIE